ncbi:hypothetical protein BGX38DRAFT_1327228 [Terfezia claveryi]|nr:hypothetical protein BGX38DRAFT_1327228 [Terfezia claveryi]
MRSIKHFTMDLEYMQMLMPQAPAVQVPTIINFDSTNPFNFAPPSLDLPYCNWAVQPDSKLSFIHPPNTGQNMMIPGYSYQARKPNNPDHYCLIQEMATIMRRRMGVKYDPTMWSSTPQALKVLEDSYMRKARETAHILGTGQLFWPDLDSLTEGYSELFMKVIVLNNALRDITLFQDFALSMFHRPDKDRWFSAEGYGCKPECIKVLGLNNVQSATRVNENTCIPQEEGPWRAVHRDPASYQELDIASRRHDYQAFTMPDLSIAPYQQGGLSTDASPKPSALLGNVTTGSRNCISAFASRHQFTPNCRISGDTRESVNVSYNTNALVEHPQPNFFTGGDVTTNHIGGHHDTSQLQLHSDPEPAAVNGPAWTVINETRDHKTATNLKGVLCPIKNCSRNSLPSPKYFARADNLGSHLRKVHGINIPSRARVRHWITGNKSQVLLHTAEEKTRELHELGILGQDGTWE